MTTSSRGDPASLGGLARLAILSRVWRHGPPVGDDAAKAFYFLKSRVPTAAGLLSKAAIAALIRPPPPGGCSWCTARFLAATSFGALGEVEDDDIHGAFLGAKCHRCRAVFAAAEVADRERDHLDQVTAAGLSAAAAGRIRGPAQLAVVAHMRQLEQAHRSQGGPAPTGAIWPTGRGVQSAYTAAINTWASQRRS